MSAAQKPGLRLVVGRLLVALTACTVVAGGATLAVASDEGQTTQQYAGEDNNWPLPLASPTPTPTPTN